MMNNHQSQNDLYYDPQQTRSTGAQRHQQPNMLQQPASRHFEAYGNMPSNLYNQDEQPLRYEGSRFDRMNGQMNNMGYAYDAQQTQSWNPNAFSNGGGFAPYGGPGRLKTQNRGRSTLPNVSTSQDIDLHADSTRPGWTSLPWLPMQPSEALAPPLSACPPCATISTTMMMS